MVLMGRLFEIDRLPVDSGVVVPIPTFPLASTRILSNPDVTTPNTLVAGSYNPVDKSLKKVYDGADTVPGRFRKVPLIIRNPDKSNRPLSVPAVVNATVRPESGIKTPVVRSSEDV
jgi:hypothetical protein